MTTDRPETDLEALEALALDDFSCRVIRGGARVLADRENPLRLNLFATASRMLLEHLMGTLAPRDQVEACWWYALEKGTDKPTRAQRIRYCLRGGLTDEFVHDELRIDLGPLEASLVRAYSQLSKHVHGRAETVVEDEAKQDTEAKEIVSAIGAFLSGYRGARAQLLDPLAESLDSGAIDALLSETILSVDELASHHSVEDVYIHETKVESIGAEWVRYRTTGCVDVVLQWGSNSDLRNGDGAESEQSFPFVCTFEVPVERPQDIEDAEVEWAVDTSSWGDMFGEDEYDELPEDPDRPEAHEDLSLPTRTYDL